jgi:hypothetical protein
MPRRRKSDGVKARNEIRATGVARRESICPACDKAIKPDQRIRLKLLAPNTYAWCHDARCARDTKAALPTGTTVGTAPLGTSDFNGEYHLAN